MAAMKKPKLCVDCRHHSFDGDPAERLGDDGHYCDAKPARVSLITGSAKKWSCSILRTFSRQCGPEGKWFEMAP